MNAHPLMPHTPRTDPFTFYPALSASLFWLIDALIANNILSRLLQCHEISKAHALCKKSKAITKYMGSLAQQAYNRVFQSSFLLK